MAAVFESCGFSTLLRTLFVFSYPGECVFEKLGIVIHTLKAVVNSVKGCFPLLSNPGLFLPPWTWTTSLSSM